MLNKQRNNIRRYSRNLLAAVLCTVGCIACTQDELISRNEASSGRTIRIIASMPDDNLLTKATADPKEGFKDGDVIHVYADFTLEGETQPATSTAYGCMEFKGGNWAPKGGTSLNWPWNATKATFTAYYIPPVGSIKNQDPLSNDKNNTLSFTLSDLSNEAVLRGTDPLIATYTNVPVESAVYLQFSHIFTKLTITNLPSGEVQTNEELRLASTGLKDSLVYTREKGGNELSHDVQTNKGYLINKVTGEENNTFTITYLLPEVTGDDPSIDLRLSRKDYTPYHIIPIKQELKAGKHYTIDITKLADNYMDKALKEEEWNKGSTPQTFTANDINAYLEAIRDGKEYRKDKIQILDIYKDEKNKNVVTQLVDVDFDGKEFNPVNLSTNIIFNANFHKIKNLVATKTKIKAGNTEQENSRLSLFGTNEGIIKNLIIEGAKVKAADDAAPTHVGILAGENKANGLIDNVKIVFAENYNSITGTASTQYIGALVGYNAGTLRDCRLTGTKFTVETPATTGTVYAGGLIGYNVANTNTLIGDIAVENCRVETGSGSVVRVTAPAEGTSTSTVYAGGWAGYTSPSKGTVEKCATSASVEVVAGTTIQAGGFAGSVEKELSYCSATGVVNITNGSATKVSAGGFAGSATNVDMNACFATGAIAIQETTNQIKSDECYFGGFAGSVACEGIGTSSILNCYAIGDVPADTDGGFAGDASDADTNATKIKIHNCFSKNKAKSFLVGDGATLSNYHHKGSYNGSAITAATLNDKRGSDGFQWTATPALFGTDIPYLIMGTK